MWASWASISCVQLPGHQETGDGAGSCQGQLGREGSQCNGLSEPKEVVEILCIWHIHFAAWFNPKNADYILQQKVQAGSQEMENPEATVPTTKPQKPKPICTFCGVFQMYVEELGCNHTNFDEVFGVLGWYFAFW